VRRDWVDCWSPTGKARRPSFYLQAVRELFKENRLAEGTFVALGRTLDFMSKRNVEGAWPAIGRFIIAHDAADR
jgi:hypothetical protein